jgi:transcriptional regulator with PAS, ATPase and Fis domain
MSSSGGPPVQPTRIFRRDGRPTSIEFPKCAITVKSGPDAGKEIRVEAPLIRIGTAPDCQLVLTDGTVSRVHCEIELVEEGYLLHDQSSTNGTFVGGLRVKEVYLTPGSTFTLGSTTIEFRPLAERVEVMLSERDRFGKVLGRSVKMREIFHFVEKVASKDVTILLAGETGTGKEVLAESIHEESLRRGAPFVTIDCGSIPEQLVESELFGHVKGAFTGASSDRLGAFEEADRGTIFLDEIGELPIEQQAKLLRVLEKKEIKRVGENESRKVDVRIIAATNRNLAEEVEAGRFRKDLYYRLSVVEIRIPPLRERPEDVGLLAEHILTSLAERGGRAKPKLGEDALALLVRHGWPGNVRELRNVLEKSFALAERDEISGPAVVVGSVGNDPSRPYSGGSPIDGTISYSDARERFEKEYLLELLRRNDLNVSKAARVAGIHRQSLHRLLKKHGIKASEAGD